MFTTKFKVTIGSLLALVVAGGLGANQLKLQDQVNTLSTKQALTVTVTATPSITPIASPSAKPTSSLRVVLPSKVLTVTPTPVKIVK